MTATEETTVETPGHGNAAQAVALDLVLGERDATRCSICNRPMPALDHPKFELEDANTGLPLDDVCANRQHRPLRLAVAFLQAVVEAHAAGDKQAASEAVEAIANGFAMLDEIAPKVPYRRPVRQQPRRQPRRGRRG